MISGRHMTPKSGASKRLASVWQASGKMAGETGGFLPPLGAKAPIHPRGYFWKLVGVGC